MNFLFKRRFLALALLLLANLSFSANNQESATAKDSSLTTSNQPTIDREAFESGMSEQRKITEQVGFCIQQLLQTIDAKKIQLASSQKQHVVIELLTLQDFIKNLLEKLFVQNSRKTLDDVIVANQVLIDYLLSVVTNDLTTINVTKLFDQLQKRSLLPLPQERLAIVAQKNLQNIENLVNATDNIGLTWYNFTYRGLKKHNAYSVAKGVGIAAISVVVLGYVAANFRGISESLDNTWFFKSVVGPSPYQFDEKHKKYHLMPTANLTFIGKMETIIGNFQRSGLISIGALLTINYKDVFSKLYQDPALWAQEKATKKLIEMDKRLQGIAKVGVNDHGFEKIYFKDLVGCGELEELAKKIANFMKHPERYERAQIEEHRCILLHGKPQTGKTLFAKALRTLVEEELGDKNKVHFIDGKSLFDRGYPIEYIFWEAAYYAPCILFLDEIDLIGTHRDKNTQSVSQLLTCMQGIDNTAKQIFVIGATNRPEQLDNALVVDGRFGKKILIEYPKYEYRKIFLHQQLAKRSITNLSQEYIDCIAQETEGCSYNNLKRIITEAIIFSSIETRPVCQKDFEKALDNEIRKIQPARTMSDEEKRIIAIYQAGKAVARYVLQTNYDVVKITINPVTKDVKTAESVVTIKTDSINSSDNEKLAANKQESYIKLGEVFTKSKANHIDLLSDDQQVEECLALLAGNTAQQMLLHKTYTQCNKQDRAEAMQIIYNMISNGEKVDDKIKALALELKGNYEQRLISLLEPHKELIQKIADVLVKQNTIDRYEWKAIISK